ncbi:NAD-dependent epimerase/dehydratase family protein [Kitasatospora sp. NPDC049258]|uniref:NAD-dependent epimerase/dehydratase family protein n=1 Tax=Kitasatospora sp. NPDC049258 TaxID=3155394 RepID=UPI003413E720
MNAVAIEGSRCLVTGGAGTIGSTVVDQLIQGGAREVIVLDNLVRGRLENLAPARAAAAPGQLRMVEGDIRDRALLRELLGDDTDLLFHLAAIRITQCAAEPRLALEIMVDGTFDVVEAAAEKGVKKVIASSTASVYGLADTFPTPESQHPYNNDTFYGAAKVFNEGLLRSFHAMYGLDYVALRYFNVYGPRMDVHGRYTEVFIRWMERIAAGQPPLIFGDGLQTMDFVHTEDIARANLLAAQAPVTDRVYNIASASEVSLRGLADALLAAMDRTDLDVEHGPARGTAGGVVRRLADISAAERDLGWKPELGLDDGLRQLVAWWREQ